MAFEIDDPCGVVISASSMLSSAGVEVAACGGLTLAMYGNVRETRDADLTISTSHQAAIAALSGGTTVEFSNTAFGGLVITRLAIAGGDKLNVIDLITPQSGRYASAILQRALDGTLRNETVRVVSPEDHILLELLSPHVLDLEDAKSVVEKLGPQLDRDLLASEVSLLSTEIPDHDVRGRYAAILGE